MIEILGETLAGEALKVRSNLFDQFVGDIGVRGKQVGP